MQGGWRRAMHGFEHGGEGGLVSCIDDLLAWNTALSHPKPGLLPAGLLKHLTSPAALNGSHASPYARGLEHSVVDGQPGKTLKSGFTYAEAAKSQHARGLGIGNNEVNQPGQTVPAARRAGPEPANSGAPQRPGRPRCNVAPGQRRTI